MLVHPNQIRNSVNAKYILWNGEMTVRVVQHEGVHGYFSAAVVVERFDDPLEVRHWSGYKGNYLNKPDRKEMLHWIAEQLTDLSTGTQAAAGKCGDVEGLRAFAMPGGFSDNAMLVELVQREVKEEGR